MSNLYPYEESPEDRVRAGARGGGRPGAGTCEPAEEVRRLAHALSDLVTELHKKVSALEGRVAELERGR